MKDTIEIIEKIIKAGRTAFNKARKDKTKTFRLSLDSYNTGDLIGRHLIALGYTLSFTPKHASWKGLVELPYYNHSKLTIIDHGIPDTLGVNLVITQVAKEICNIEVNESYYLKDEEIKTAYNIAKANAKDVAKTYKAYSSKYADADKFEIGES